jgi:plasmid stability protein
MKRITIDLDDELYRKVKIRCAEDGVTLADVIRKLLVGSLEKNPKKKVNS